MAKSLWEPNFDRLMTVLRLEGEPDRVPFFDLFIDMQIAEPVLGQPLPQDADELRKYRVEFMAKLGYDFVVGRHTFGFPGREGLLAEDTAVRSSGQRSWRDEAHGPLESWEKFDKYQWPRVEDASCEDIEKLEPLLPEGMKVIPVLPNGPLENLVGLMGYEPLCYALRDDLALVEAVADRIGEAELALYEKFCDGGGWALGSGNSIANYIPVENFLAMLDEGRKAGVYGSN